MAAISGQLLKTYDDVVYRSRPGILGLSGPNRYDPKIAESNDIGGVARELESLATDISGRQPDSCADSDALERLTSRLEALVDILIARGALRPGHRRILAKIGGNGRPRVKLNPASDKRAVPSPDIDCATLLHLCQARCCSFAVTLSREDLEDGLRWEIADPYVLERRSDNSCCHLGERGQCTVYERRPAACRSYDCRTDRRVWLNWEEQIPAPMSPPATRAD